MAGADEGLARLAALLPADPATPGAGAAGGAGFALLAWGAQLEPGASAVAELVGLPEAVAGSAVVVTGEGAFDAQSASGKAPAHVAALAAAAGVPVMLAAGRIAAASDVSSFTRAVSLTELAGSTDAALAGVRNRESSIAPEPSGAVRNSISTSVPVRPFTRSAHEPPTLAVSLRWNPSISKNAATFSRSWTMTPMCSKLRTPMLRG